MIVLAAGKGGLAGITHNEAATGRLRLRAAGA